MRIEWSSGSGGPGINRGHLSFDNPSLGGFRWPVVDIVGREAGPRLCVMAGVHVNEASSLEAAVSLWRAIDPALLRGTVSIMPVVNIPGIYGHTMNVPVDDKNIHWLYPGNPHGSFTEALADALLFDWSADAAALIDMHGGEMWEDLTTYVVFQRSDDPVVNNRNEVLARCFAPPLIFGLPAKMSNESGRSCQALGRVGRVGLVSESGRNALLTRSDVQFHRDGVLNVARQLGLLPQQPLPPGPEPILLDDYQFMVAPASGLIYSHVRGGEPVTRGQRLATITDLFQHTLAELTAVANGWVMWITTHTLSKEGEWIGALGTSGAPPPAIRRDKAYV
jgi:uncharacterized protein